MPVNQFLQKDYFYIRLNMIINFKDRKTLITGGTRGIGKACVELFAEADSDIAFTYNTSSSAAGDLVEKFKKRIKIKSYHADMTDPEKLELTVKNIVEDFDGIDILINNAGIWEFGEADSMTFKEWDKTITTNLSSIFAITKNVLQGMKQRKFGKIINVSSTAGQRGEAFHSHYAASKGGMIAFTKSLAAEVGQYNINVNAVAPGWVLTDMSNPTLSDKKYLEKVLSEIPLRRIATAEDVAGPVFFLASEFARHINGEILNINGGSVLCG